MIRRKKNNIEWLEFKKLQGIPNLVHGVFLRGGGFSSGSYNSLNAGGGSGDEPTLISKNRQLMQETLSIPLIIGGKQVHKDTIIHVNSQSDCGECDGLVTREKGIGLIIKHADCQAAIFYDTKKKTIANVHCGWRGNVQNIYGKTVAEMKANPKDLIVCISPSLGPEFSEFKNYREELPEHFWPYQHKPLYFNLWEISKKQLLDAGIPESNIEIASLCTYANPSDFFSYRRDKITGRNATLVSLL